jgi:hypothetical protein
MHKKLVRRPLRTALFSHLSNYVNYSNTAPRSRVACFMYTLTYEWIRLKLTRNANNFLPLFSRTVTDLSAGLILLLLPRLWRTRHISTINPLLTYEIHCYLRVSLLTKISSAYSFDGFCSWRNTSLPLRFSDKNRLD